MLLSGALFALFMMGFWVYCLTDAILTPAAECRGLRKQTWVAVISVTFIGGAVAWLIVRRPASSVPLLLMRGAPAEADNVSRLRTHPEEALARHPAGRARSTDADPKDPKDPKDPRATPKGPDDDAEFLRKLGRAIRRNPNPPVS